jgi:hypothetical protein
MCKREGMTRSTAVEKADQGSSMCERRKDGPSDLQRGNGSKWRGLLRDSTVERIRRDRGEVLPIVVPLAPVSPDPLDRRVPQQSPPLGPVPPLEVKLRCAPV